MRRLLRDPETDPNALDLNGNTPLMASVRSGSLVAVLELLRCADVLPNEPNDRGISPLHYACGSAKVRRLFPSIVRAFADVSPWVNLNARDLVRGESPLIAACRTGYHSAALVLMEDPNVDVWLRDIDGKTALDYADAGLRSQSLASKRFRSRKKAVLGPGSLVAVRNDKDWAIAVSETGHSKDFITVHLVMPQPNGNDYIKPTLPAKDVVYLPDCIDGVTTGAMVFAPLEGMGIYARARVISTVGAKWVMEFHFKDIPKGESRFQRVRKGWIVRSATFGAGDIPTSPESPLFSHVLGIVRASELDSCIKTWFEGAFEDVRKDLFHVMLISKCIAVFLQDQQSLMEALDRHICFSDIVAWGSIMEPDPTDKRRTRIETLREFTQILMKLKEGEPEVVSDILHVIETAGTMKVDEVGAVGVRISSYLNDHPGFEALFFAQMAVVCPDWIIHYIKSQMGSDCLPLLESIHDIYLSK